MARLLDLNLKGADSQGSAQMAEEFSHFPPPHPPVQAALESDSGPLREIGSSWEWGWGGANNRPCHPFKAPLHLLPAGLQGGTGVLAISSC